MRVYRSLESVPPEFGPSALSIGNFDGVHLGHRRILKRVAELAAERGWKASALTFDPHPTRIVAPERTPRLMTTPEQRVELMRGEGVGQALILPFTPAVARLTPEEFVRRIVAGPLGARAVLVGENFHFGYRQSGDVSVLRSLGLRYGFETEIVRSIVCRGRMVSSSAIRELIRNGRVSLAARFLSQPYGVEGQVVRGRGVGSKQTVPTLNLATSAEVIPPPGVYATRTRDLQGAAAWESITNIGYRPTFGPSDELTIETFLLDPLTGETPRRIRVEFLCRVREERRFEDPAKLKAQILFDVRSVQNYFRRLRVARRDSC